jgi:predicted ATPase
MKYDIGEDFEIESIGGECYKLGIIEDVDHPENITPLLDKGVGSNQIMILLLQLATIMHKNRGASVPPMVIIEEPEQNLHPKLQSCLADLFREVYLYPLKQNKNSRGISFIIETHSEYLVRKSQVLVAKREQTDANPFTVFYMEKGKEPREIRYQDSGVFYDDFGEGFYDEAISLTEEIV